MNAEYKRLESAARDVEDQIQGVLQSSVVTSTAEHVQAEQKLAELHVKLGSLRHGMLLLRSVDSAGMGRRIRWFIKALPHRYYSQGCREKKVNLPGGVTVTLVVTYYRRSSKDEQVRNKPRRGLFPALMILGISEKFTPGVRTRMAKAAALLGSFEEAAEMLAEQGLCVSVNQIRKVTATRGAMLGRLTSEGALKPSGDVTGRRIVVTTDGGRSSPVCSELPLQSHGRASARNEPSNGGGGRVRLREPRRGKTKKGRKKFAANWREPRLFMIYAVDENGRLAKGFPPVIDGSLGSCDQLFAMMACCLKGLSIAKADRVLFVADGAAWIWKRVPSLLKSLGVKNDQVQQLIDFWHVVEYLGKLADSKKLKGTEKKRWMTTQKNRLLRSEIGSVVEALKTLLGDRKTKDQKRWLNYFINHGIELRQMDYSISREHHMPIGSGAIESAVRRVINLRVKSNGMYWLRENAETMIRLRSWIKAGRATELFQQTTSVTPAMATRNRQITNPPMDNTRPRR